MPAKPKRPTSGPISDAKVGGVSDDYWSGLVPEHRALYATVRPMQLAAYEVDIHLNHLESFLTNTQEDVEGQGGVFDLDPVYQRGHVWTQPQRERFVEAVIRGRAPGLILFNCPGFTRTSDGGDIPPQTFQCIDGLQRLTALRMFMRGDVVVFDGLRCSDLYATPFDPRRMRVKVGIYEFNTAVALLQFYLDLNAGGTVHAPRGKRPRKRLARCGQGGGNSTADLHAKGRRMRHPSSWSKGKLMRPLTLPRGLEFAEGYTSDYVVFARSSIPDLMTNLREAGAIPAAARALCESSAGLALIAATMALSKSVAYLDSNGRGLELIERFAPLLAADFLGTLVSPEATVLHLAGDLQAWLHDGAGLWWTRSVGNPPAAGH